MLIDPGHGGDDKGAERIETIGKNSKKIIYEKDLCLAISKKVHQRLQSMGISSYLTRSVDRNVSLQERADLANKLKADLFISIHINSDRGRDAQGFETYYLDNHQDKAVKKVEGVENKELEGSEKVVNQILIDLVIERTAPASKKLAELIHKQIEVVAGPKYNLKNRGAKAGLFYVLALSKRPSVLLEVGFLSNGHDTRSMLDEKFQDDFAQSVAQGIQNYLLGT